MASRHLHAVHAALQWLVVVCGEDGGEIAERELAGDVAALLTARRERNLQYYIIVQLVYREQKVR